MAGSNGNGNGNGNGGAHGAERDARPGRTMAMLRRHGAAFLRHRAGGRPRMLELQVTRGCDARCAGCDAWRAPGDDAEMADFAPVVRRIQPLDVALIGGEPLLRPDLERLAASIRLGTPVASLILVTNGIALSPDRARRLHDAGVDKLVLSIEGVGEETDRVRRCPGLFARLAGMLPQLVAVGFRAVQLQVTITGRNSGQLVETARWAREQGVRVSYTLDGPARLEARGGARDAKDLAVLEEALDQLAGLAESWSHVVSSPEYLRRVVPFLRGEAADLPPCGAGSSFLRVTPDGWVRPCAALPPLGHWSAFPFPPATFDCPGCWSRLRGESSALLGVSRLVELYRSSGAVPA